MPGTGTTHRSEGINGLSESGAALTPADPLVVTTHHRHISDAEVLLGRHLARELGSWPPQGLTRVVGSARRNDVAAGPGRSVLALTTPQGTVVSVSPVERLRYQKLLGLQLRSVENLAARLAGLLGTEAAALQRRTFSWSEAPTDLPNAGVWAASTSVVAEHFPYDGSLLLATRRGRVIAAVHRTRSDRWSSRLRIAVDAAQRTSDLGARLLAQAARSVHEDGQVPTFVPLAADTWSADVARASGFAHGQWSCLAY